MGTSKSFAEVAAKLDDLASGLRGSGLKAITSKTALRTKQEMGPLLKPSSLSHWGRGARRGSYSLKVRYKLQGDAQADVTPSPKPLAGLLERGSYKAGTTWKAPRRRGAARRKKGAIATYQRRSVRGRGTWTGAVKQVEPQIPQWAGEELGKLVKQAMR